MTRMSFFVGIATMAVVAGATAVVAQSPSRPQQRAPQITSKGIAALQHAAAADKYLFVFLWKENGAQTDSMWKVFQPAMSKLADRAESVAVKVSDPAEKPFVDRFGLERSPLPLVLALAPNGAITKGIPSKLTEGQLAQAFVSPGTAGCLKALQSRKLVLLCVQSRTLQAQQAAVPQGVADFAADERYAGATEIVALVEQADGARQNAFVWRANRIDRISPVMPAECFHVSEPNDGPGARRMQKHQGRRILRPADNDMCNAESSGDI